MQNKISLCMVVKNEEMLLGRRLKNISPIADEIIVVDTGSTDNTIKIAKKYGAHIIHYRWDGSLGRARNVYIKNASSNWILVLDADERIARSDLPKLKKLTKDSKVLGYIFTRRDYTKTYDLLRDWHPNNGKYPEEEKFSQCPGWSLTKYIRLFQRKEEVRYEEGYSAHTDFIESLRKHKGKIKECDIVIHHFQCLKGEKFIFDKQKERLKSEIRHLKSFPDNPWSYLNIGITLFNLKKDDKAIEYLKKAIKIDPLFDIAYFVLGMAYKENLRYKEAILNLKKAIQINPKYADAWTVLGIVYDGQGRLSKAEKALEKALSIRPFHPLAHNSLGIVYQNQGRLIEAEKEYKKAIKIHPQHPNAHYNLANLYSK